MSANWLQYLLSLGGIILSGAAGVLWSRQNGFDTKLDAMDEKLTQNFNDHKLEDERTFAKKDDVRHLYEIVSRQLAELKENQERNVERLTDKLDQLLRNGK